MSVYFTVFEFTIWARAGRSRGDAAGGHPQQTGHHFPPSGIVQTSLAQADPSYPAQLV